MSLEYDEAVCADEGCLHDSPPQSNEVLYPEAFTVAPGYLSLSYAGGLDEDDLVAFREMGNRVSQVTVRFDCIEPQTGAQVQMTFVMSTMLAHHLGLELAGSAWHHSASADDVWSPQQQPDPGPDGLRMAAQFYEQGGSNGD